MYTLACSGTENTIMNNTVNQSDFIQQSTNFRLWFHVCRVLDIREFKKPRRRRRGQRRLKNELYFSYEYRDTRKSFSLFLSVKSISKLNLEHSDKFEIEI